MFQQLHDHLHHTFHPGRVGTGDCSELVFFVNGKKVVEPQADPDETLLHYLRETLGLKGTKLGCGQGACGACSVMISRYDRTKKKTCHKAVTSCLTPLCSVHGCAITTVEGVGSLRSGLHPIQKRLAEGHGIQCGFCTPGMVMSMYALLRSKPNPSKRDIDIALDSNLCRCTGYRGIVQSFHTFSDEFKCEMGEKCCRNAKPGEKSTASDDKGGDYYKPYDATQEPIFPSELQFSDAHDTANLKFEGVNAVWYRPGSLKAFCELRKAHPHASLVGGFTSEGFTEAAAKHDGERRTMIAINGLREVHCREQTANGLKLGAALTVNEARAALRDAIDGKKDAKLRSLSAVLAIFNRFASNQIRNMATVGGSIVANYHNSDLIVPLLATGASMTMVGRDGRQHEVPLSTWCSNGRFTPAPHDAIILAVTIPYSTENCHVFTYKQAERRAMARSIVNAGLQVSKDERKVQRALLCFGGIAEKGIVCASKTMAAMTGKPWSEAMFEDATRILRDELMHLGAGEQCEYRCSLALGFFTKFYYQVCQESQGQDTCHVASLGDIGPCSRTPSSAVQVWQELPKDQPEHDAAWRPLVHVAAQQMATGEALYYTDLPKREDELFLGLVRSTKANAEILKIDTSEALKMPGVFGYVGAEDVPGQNEGHGFSKDEFIFANKKVEMMGQTIGGICAETPEQARKAAAAVKITYKEFKPIVTIEEACAAKSFYEHATHSDGRGDLETGFAAADHIREGSVKIGGQEHFYMETYVAIIIPLKDSEEYEAHVCCQNITDAQESIARALGVPMQKVLVRLKRIGGSFGGKESRPSTVVAQPAAVAAYKFRRPVRCHLNREEDITTTGSRHPFIIKYKAGFKKDGTITAIEYNLYQNMGSVGDMSPFVGRLAVTGTDGPYRVPHLKSTVIGCKTNTLTGTAMRGFGRPQVLYAVERVVTDIAEVLGVLPEEVRNKNLLAGGDHTLYGSPVSNNMRNCWNRLDEQCNFKNMRQQVAEFNRSNKFKKRGMAVVPTVFGVGFPILTLWQGAAHVIAYVDGSVLVAHGGVEMGQGLNTKMVQVASRELGLPAEKIHISETATNITPHATSTGGSTGTDLNGPAVMDACRQLKKRLQPIIEANPNGTWKDWVQAAYANRISLAAAGFYTLHEDKWPQKEWPAALYYTYGVACSEIELDTLTGEHAILQTDIVMDVGRSVNPAIDVGQIEGGFLQGRGLHTMEQLTRDEHGFMLNRCAGTYKISTVADIPQKFNVTLLTSEDEGWERPVYSSKGIGEPPVALGSAVYFALKDAVGEVRKENGMSGPFDIDSPATVERVRMACTDKITKLVHNKAGEYKPGWRG